MEQLVVGRCYENWSRERLFTGEFGTQGQTSKSYIRRVNEVLQKSGLSCLGSQTKWGLLVGCVGGDRVNRFIHSLLAFFEGIMVGIVFHATLKWSQ